MTPAGAAPAPPGTTVADLMDPASEIAEHATLGDLEPALRRDELGFFRSPLGWEAVVPRLVVGLPSSRRVIDVPRVPVAALEPQSDALGVLPLLERSPLASSPVVAGDRLVGRLMHDRVRHALRDERDDDVLSELITLRQASSAITHDLANVLMVALWEVGASPSPSPSLAAALQHSKQLLDRLRLMHRGEPAVSIRLDLGAAVDRLLPLLGPLSKPNRLEFTPPPAPVDVRCPPTLIDRVLVNLVANARDAAEQAGRTTISIRREGAAAVLEVSDDGPGIPPDALPRVFEAGYTTKPEHQGLGLATLRRAVRRLGGDVDLQSALGVGTRVRVRLPAA